MTYNKFYLLQALMLSSALLSTIESRPSPQELNSLQTKVVEAGGVPVHHRRGRTKVHTHEIVSPGGDGEIENGAPETHVYHTEGPTEIHTHKVITQGGDGGNEIPPVTQISANEPENTVRTISLSEVPVVNSGNKSPAVTIPVVNGIKCKKNFIYGITSKVRDVLNGGANKLETVINRLTKNGTLLGPVGGLVNAIGEGVDDIFENGISGLKLGIDDIVCALEGIEMAAAQTLHTGDLKEGVADIGKTVLTEAKSLLKDVVGGAGAGIGGAVHDAENFLKDTLHG